MKTINKSIIAGLLVLITGCNLVFVAETNHNTIDKSSIKKCIGRTFKNPHNIVISDDFLDTVFLYWSDPDFVAGPTIAVNLKCWKITFCTNTFNDDSSLRYTDFYEYYVLKDYNHIFRHNRYQGKGYHGGSFILLKDENDNHFSDISPRLVRNKDEFARTIEDILKRNKK